MISFQSMLKDKSDGYSIRIEEVIPIIKTYLNNYIIEINDSIRDLPAMAGTMRRDPIHLLEKQSQISIINMLIKNL